MTYNYPQHEQVMGKILIITEKPSVAADIARALGGFKRHKEYYESEKYILSWAVGHLLELEVPKELKHQDKWDLSVLPVIPEYFDLKPIEGTRSRIKVLCKLIHHKDTEAIINACDAGREGELIFRYILQYCKADKPVLRLWLQSMTPEAIREAFEHLRTDSEMQPLAQAARSRNEADWLVGINATRAFTLRLRRGKGNNITTLGRVQTPTLAIIVDRERKIQQFVPRNYWETLATFEAPTGTYQGKWFDESFTKDEPERDRILRLSTRFGLSTIDVDQILFPEKGALWEEHRQAGRLWAEELIQALAAKCTGKKGIVESEEKKPTTQSPPLLYDLTTLQREANTKLGLPAARTLQIAQALYEKYKLITYPRTDSRHLPEDYIPTVYATLNRMLKCHGDYSQAIEKILQYKWVKPNKRIFNNAKVSDHFAIIPTGQTTNELNQQEREVYNMILLRFIAAFYPPAQYEVTTRITRVEGEPFKTEGKVLINPGWLEVYGKEQTQEASDLLPPVPQGQVVTVTSIDISKNSTNPPPRFTEATILTAMEGAGELVEEEELREAMKEKGLGTPATRAQIIENLIDAGYLLRRGRELVPTPKAISTIDLLRKVVPVLTSPQMTGEWEYKLRKIEHGQLSRSEFMEEIKLLTKEIVEKAKTFNPNQVVDESPIGPCPRCGQPVMELIDRYRCSKPDCGFSIWKSISGRWINRSDAQILIQTGKLGPLEGFITHNGKPFSATLKLSPDYKIQIEPEVSNRKAAIVAEASSPNTKSLGPCPKCGAPVVETDRQYACESAITDQSCTFSCSKTILGLSIPREQISKLLCDKKTDLLKGFTSKRGKKFDACLALTEKGEIKFVFNNNQGG